MKRFVKVSGALTLATLLASAGALRAEAGVVTFDLNHNIGTGNAGGGVTVTITDASGNVSIAVTNNSGGFISDLYLNFSPNADLAGADVVNFSDGAHDVAQPTIQFNGLQGFAIDFAFQTANSDPGRFGPGESVTFDLDASAAITAAQFNNLGGRPTGDDYYAAVHVNSAAATGDCGAGSAKIGDLNGGNVAGGGDVTSCGGRAAVSSVPEPATFALLGLGIAGLAASRRRKR